MQEHIDDLITNEFIPTLLQGIITDQDRALYSLPVNMEVQEYLFYQKYQKYTTNIRNQY